MKEGPLVQMLDRQRVQQAAADEAKKLVDAAALAAERLVDATKGREACQKRTFRGLDLEILSKGS